jgi:hypothetical protein
MVELTLMSNGRELVHRTAPFAADALITLAAHRHLIGLAALDGVRAGLFEMPQQPPADAATDASQAGAVLSEERVEALVLEQAQAVGLISADELSKVSPSGPSQVGAELSAADERTAAVARVQALELELRDEDSATEPSEVIERAAAEAQPGAVLQAVDERVAALKRTAAPSEEGSNDDEYEARTRYTTMGDGDPDHYRGRRIRYAISGDRDPDAPTEFEPAAAAAQPGAVLKASDERAAAQARAAQVVANDDAEDGASDGATEPKEP